MTEPREEGTLGAPPTRQPGTGRVRTDVGPRRGGPGPRGVRGGCGPDRAWPGSFVAAGRIAPRAPRLSRAFEEHPPERTRSRAFAVAPPPARLRVACPPPKAPAASPETRPRGLRGRGGPGRGARNGPRAGRPGPPPGSHAAPRAPSARPRARTPAPAEVPRVTPSGSGRAWAVPPPPGFPRLPARPGPRLFPGPSAASPAAGEGEPRVTRAEVPLPGERRGGPSGSVSVSRRR